MRNFIICMIGAVCIMLVSSLVPGSLWVCVASSVIGMFIEKI